MNDCGDDKLIESLNGLDITVQKAPIDGIYVFTDEDVENAAAFLRTLQAAA